MILLQGPDILMRFALDVQDLLQTCALSVLVIHYHKELFTGLQALTLHFEDVQRNRNIDSTITCVKARLAAALEYQLLHAEMPASAIEAVNTLKTMHTITIC